MGTYLEGTDSALIESLSSLECTCSYLRSKQISPINYCICRERESLRLHLPVTLILQLLLEGSFTSVSSPCSRAWKDAINDF